MEKAVESLKQEVTAANAAVTTANEAAEKATAAKMEVELAQWNLDEKIKANTMTIEIFT